MIRYDKSYFNPKDVFECGQVFRYRLNEKGNYEVISDRYKAEVIENADSIQIFSNNDEYFKGYFDLNTDYSEIVRELSKEKYGIEKEVSYGKGIRILKQEPYETLISFIISANNNIPRIKGIIERLCVALGANMGEYYAFPTPQAMAGENEEFYKKIGCGYRSRYLFETAKRVAEKNELNDLFTLSEKEAGSRLKSFLGVGQKVADCILLFAYGKTELFPVDTWIKKVYNEDNGKEYDAEHIRRALVEKYGKLSGYAQQYIYYYARKDII